MEHLDSRYTLVSTIGEGAFSKVYLAYHKATGKQVAIKAIPKANLDSSEAIVRFHREISLLKQCNFPLVAQFYEMLESESSFSIVMEFAENGNLLDYMNARGKVAESLIKRYFIQILETVKYLHRNGIIHRDLKAENILLDRHDNVRLIDFGLSNVLGESNPGLLRTACGSPAYAPPEMIRDKNYGSGVDIWSLGILLYAIANCQLPFDDTNTQRLLQKILYTEPQYPADMSPQLIDLIKKMLVKEPSGRISLSGIESHPWIAGSPIPSIVGKLAIQAPIDSAVLDQVHMYGYDPSVVRSELEKSMFNEHTSIYRILARDRMTEEIHRAMTDRSIKVHSNTPTPDSKRLKPKMLPPIFMNKFSGSTPHPDRNESDQSTSSYKVFRSPLVQRRASGAALARQTGQSRRQRSQSFTIKTLPNLDSI